MNKKAFTLVELIATITILGVILMIAVPSYNKHIEKSKKTKCNADEQAIIDATKTFINDCIYNNVCKDNMGITEKRNVKVLIDKKYISSEYTKYNDEEIEITSEEKNGVTNYNVTVNICS